MNDHLDRQDRIAASGGLVLAYSAGATVGPLIASAVMSVLGAAGLFVFVTGAAVLVLAFGLWRTLARAPVPTERQGPFQSLPRTTPTAAPWIQGRPRRQRNSAFHLSRPARPELPRPRALLSSRADE